MKKLFIYAAAIALAVGCTTEICESPSSLKGEGITFRGGFIPETRTEFTVAENGVYPLVWTASDAIGIFSWDMTSTSNENIKAEIVQSTAGQNIGMFVPIDEYVEATDVIDAHTISIQFPSSGSERFFIYYPYKKGTVVSDDDLCIHGSVDAVQTQSTVSDKQVGKNGFSYAMASVGQDKQVDFTLTHAMAYVKFVVKTSDYASYQLHSIQLYDSKDEAVLAGKFVFNPQNSTMTPVAGQTSPSAKVVVENDNFAAPTGDGQELYLTIFPGDYSAADLKAIVSYIKTDGTTASIPVNVPNLGNVPAASLTTVQLNANKSDSFMAWYEPEESRELIDMWAYGPQNTYFVESKASGEGLTDITIDVKARGDIRKVKEPKYYGWICSSETSGTKLMQFTDGTIEREEVPTHEIGADYKITVQCRDQSATGHWASLAIYDADYNILWSYMFMKYFPDDVPADVAYPGTDIVLLDRNLGAPYSNKYAEKKGKFGNYWAYFEWGRKDPFMWKPDTNPGYEKIVTNADVDVEYVISHPHVLLAYSGTDEANSYGKWYYGELKADLWGAVNNTEGEVDNSLVGKKTVLDPCPKGYRVCDGKVLSTVLAGATRWELAKGQKGQTADLVNSSSPFTDTSVLAYSLGDGKYDYWPYSGAIWGSTAAWNNRSGSNNSCFAYWSNCFSTTLQKAYVLQGCYYSNGYRTATVQTMSHGYTIRCQKDASGK